MSSTSTPRALVLSLPLGLIGMLAILFASTWGVGVGDDSVMYLSAAQNLANGAGLTIALPHGEQAPLTHFPPFYPVVLALLVKLGLDALTAARWLNAILLSANVSLVAILAHRIGRRSGASALIAAVLVVTSEYMFQFHAMAMSEPLFMFCAFSSLLLLSVYLGSNDRRILIGAALAASAAMLTRYAGLALLPTGALALWLLSSEPRKGRARLYAAATFVGVSGGPFALWMVRNALRTGAGVDRHLQVHLDLQDFTRFFLSTIFRWFFPDQFVTAVKNVGAMATSMLRLSSGSARLLGVLLGAALILGVGAWLIIMLRGQLRPALGKLRLEGTEVLLVIFVVNYIGLLIVTASAIDALTQPDPRLLLPVYMAVSMLVARPGLAIYRFTAGRTAPRVVYVALCVALLTSYVGRSSSWLWSAHVEGIGFTGKLWQESGVLAQVRSLAGTVRIYASSESIMFFWVRTPITDIVPRKVDPTTGVANQNYAAEMDEMRRTLAAGSGVVVYFASVFPPATEPMPSPPWLPSEAELKEAIPLQLIDAEPSGSIYTGANRLCSGGCG